MFAPESLITAVLDNDDRFVDASPEMVELLGPQPGHVTGRSMRSFLAPELAGADLSESATDWCGLRADGLPWCARFTTWRPARWTDQYVLAGHRRFGPIRWADDAAPVDPPRSAGVDSVISHDIRGALRGGSGFVKVVKRAVDDPAIAGLHERLTKAGEHLDIAARSVATADETAAKVVDFLRWSVRPLLVRTLPLDQLLRQAVAQSSETFDGPAPDVRHGQLPTVTVDVELVRWALAELLTNARKFSAGPVTVDVSAQSRDRFCVISMSDDGIGIDPLLADDALLPGRKLQARGDYPGVGMGLALSQVVFERHAGWLRVDAENETGATILFRLPCSSG